jgi:hypothetical protein
LRANSPISVLVGDSIVYCMPLLRTMGSVNATSGALEWDRTYTATGVGVGIPWGPFGGEVYNMVGSTTFPYITKFAGGGGDQLWQFNWNDLYAGGGFPPGLNSMHVEGSTLYTAGNNLRLDPSAS